MAKGIREVFRDRKQILEGVANSVFKKKHIEKIAEDRLKICMSCPNVDKEGTKCFVPGTQPCCGLCGCKLGFFTRSLSSSCSDTDNPKWEAILTQEEEDEVKQKLGITD